MGNFLLKYTLSGISRFFYARNSNTIRVKYFGKLNKIAELDSAEVKKRILSHL